MEKLEKRINYTFKDKELLSVALTHSSFANEREGEKYNERLEFLGDSVLGIITAEYLFKNHKDFPEGALSKTRAALVCESSLYEFAKEIGLGSYLRLGKGEIRTGGYNRPSILADAFEALIAAIYLDGGMKKAEAFVLPFIKKAQPGAIKINKDYKTQLQEIIQKNPGEILEYVLVDESGPDHDKRFTVEVHLNSNVIGKGVGKSKKQAEQNAAGQVLELMGL